MEKIIVGISDEAKDFLSKRTISLSARSLINRETYRTFIYTRKHRLFRARNHSVDTKSLGDIREAGPREKSALSSTIWRTISPVSGKALPLR